MLSAVLLHHLFSLYSFEVDETSFYLNNNKPLRHMCDTDLFNGATAPSDVNT